MKWSIRVARVGGIDLKVHVTFLIFLAWIAVTYYLNGGVQAALQGTLFVVLLFLCVVLHEMGHALTARVFGIRTPDITLLPIGGVARLERIPTRPVQELLIAIAGPLVNVVIAFVLFFILHQRVSVSDLSDLDNPRLAMMARLASVNVVLVLFNLIPAFPMDGGRVLRALLAMKMSYYRATQIAAVIGQALAFVFAFIGLFYNPLLIFIAVFVYLGAKQEAILAKIKTISENLSVADAMITQLQTFHQNATLGEAAEIARRASQHEFPVVDDAQHVLGILTRENLVDALSRLNTNIRVAQVTQRDLPTVRPEDRLDEAFTKMQEGGYAALPVVDIPGQFMGLITLENVGELIAMNSGPRKEGGTSWRPAPAGG